MLVSLVFSTHGLGRTRIARRKGLSQVPARGPYRQKGGIHEKETDNEIQAALEAFTEKEARHFPSLASLDSFRRRAAKAKSRQDRTEGIRPGVDTPASIVLKVLSGGNTEDPRPFAKIP